MRNLDMSLVFKLNSVEDLGLLHAALKQVKTLQEMVKLERDVKTLTRQKKLLENEIAGIRTEIYALCPEKLKLDEKTDPSEDDTEEVESVMEDVERIEERLRVEHEAAPSSLIEERTDEAPQEEDETVVESDSTPEG